MEIAALSIGLSQANTQQSAGVMVLKKAMSQGENTAAALLEILPQAPSFGHRLDVRA